MVCYEFGFLPLGLLYFQAGDLNSLIGNLSFSVSHLKTASVFFKFQYSIKLNDNIK